MIDNIYFLSIYDQYVSMIINGQKKWEFRENPRFGIHAEWEIEIGDVIFVVSTSPNPEDSPLIKCMCRVVKILRNEEMKEYFSQKQTNHWKETGCEDNTTRDWNFFERNILNAYSTAIRLEVFPVCPVIDVSMIRHRTKHSSWNGHGFTPARDLKRFHIFDNEVTDYFANLSSQILSNKLIC